MEDYPLCKAISPLAELARQAEGMCSRLYVYADPRSNQFTSSPSALRMRQEPSSPGSSIRHRSSTNSLIRTTHIICPEHFDESFSCRTCCLCVQVILFMESTSPGEFNLISKFRQQLAKRFDGAAAENPHSQVPLGGRHSVGGQRGIEIQPDVQRVIDHAVAKKVTRINRTKRNACCSCGEEAV